MVHITQNWRLVILRGIAAILFGISAFLWPALTLFGVVMLVGVYALAEGLITLVAGMKRLSISPRRWAFVPQSLICIGAGTLSLAWPEAAALALLAMIAAWAILTGVLKIATATHLHISIRREWVLAGSGIVSVAVGLAFILQPEAGALVIIWTLGAYAFAFGVMWIMLGLRLRNLGRMMRHH